MGENMQATDFSNAVIFGQEDYVGRLAAYFSKLLPQGDLQSFSFPLSTDNPSQYVFSYDAYDEELRKMDKGRKILVAFGNAYRPEATKHLHTLGFRDICFYDSELDNELKRDYFKQEFAERNKPFSLVCEPKTVAVYMARHVKDKILKSYPGELPSWVIPIQVGASLTKERVADVTDDIGDNISDRNRHYSEMTAFYWMWKHGTADYLGICHYRRLWKDLDVIVKRLQEDAFDVVLPMPTVCLHSVFEDYLKKFIPDVYPVMLDVLKDMSPEYYESSREIFAGKVFYASNMLIARREVLDSLCSWMFPMVMEIEKRVGDLPDAYANRYAGFCTERLITLYFLSNKQNWRIGHAEKIFVE